MHRNIDETDTDTESIFVYRARIQHTKQYKLFRDKWQLFTRLCNVINIKISDTDDPKSIITVHTPDKFIAYAFMHDPEHDRVLYQCAHDVKTIKVYLSWGVYVENDDDGTTVARHMALLANAIDCDLEYTTLDKSIVLYVHIDS